MNGSIPFLLRNLHLWSTFWNVENVKNLPFVGLKRVIIFALHYGILTLALHCYDRLVVCKGRSQKRKFDNVSVTETMQMFLLFTNFLQEIQNKN